MADASALHQPVEGFLGVFSIPMRGSDHVDEVGEIGEVPRQTEEVDREAIRSVAGHVLVDGRLASVLGITIRDRAPGARSQPYPSR